MKLAPKQRCPIHHNFTCDCRRKLAETVKRGSKWETVRPGVRRIRDPRSDFGDGWRYKYSPAETRKVLLKKIEEQKGLCALCDKPFADLAEVDPDHRLPRGMNASRRDDRFIQAAHRSCNLRKGSKREVGHG